MSSIQVGHRVTHANDGRAGLVVGRVEGTGWNKALVPIAIEGSTRSEYWPVSQVVIRPAREQAVAMGGKFQPPKGYPLNLK
jgi:hypothetical protein